MDFLRKHRITIKIITIVVVIIALFGWYIKYGGPNPKSSNATQQASTQNTAPSPDYNQPLTASSIISLLNIARSGSGISVLSENQELDQAATATATYMVQNNYTATSATTVAGNENYITQYGYESVGTYQVMGVYYSPSDLYGSAAKLNGYTNPTDYVVTQLEEGNGKIFGLSNIVSDIGVGVVPATNINSNAQLVVVYLASPS